MGDLLKPTLSLFIICAVVTAALAFTFVGTRDAIADRAAQDAENARIEVMSGVDGFEAVDGLNGMIAGNPELSIVKEAYKALKGSSVEGYVFSIYSKGYGGDIKITVGVNMEGKVTGIKIGDNTETPGLGSKATEEPFLSQFDNLFVKEPLRVVKGTKSKTEEINAVSGATITSKAVVKAVQAACDTAAMLVEKEGR